MCVIRNGTHVIINLSYVNNNII